MRVLIFNWKDTSHPYAGGAEVFTERVAGALVDRGHEVTLFASRVEGLPEQDKVTGVEIVRRGGRFGVYWAARRFWSEQPPGHFDVVVDEINTRPFMTPRFVRGTPIVALIHQLAREIWFYETPLPVAALGRYVLEPWWLRAYRGIPALTVSESSAESLRRYHGWKDITVLPEGLDPHPVPHVAKESNPTAVFLGRLVRMKRPADALHAFSMCAERFQTAQMWAIGDGPLLEHLRRSAPPGVSFLGRIDRADVLARLARAHVLVATSIREGWGLNVSEAAACGTPTIGYRVPGLTDSISASGGALVPATPEALGDALIRFFAGCLTLRPNVSTVTWPEVATAIEVCLERVISQAGRGWAVRERQL